MSTTWLADVVGLDYFEDPTPPGESSQQGYRARRRRTQPQESIETKEQLRSLLNRVDPFLTREQRDYFQGCLDGKVDVDYLWEMKLLVRQVSLLFHTIAMDQLQERKVTKELGELTNALRMSLKDLFEMQKYEDERAKEQQEQDDMVRVTDDRTALEGLDEILRAFQQERAA